MSDRKKRMAELTAELGQLQREEENEFKESIRQRVLKACEGLDKYAAHELRRQLNQHVGEAFYDQDDNDE